MYFNLQFPGYSSRSARSPSKQSGTARSIQLEPNPTLLLCYLIRRDGARYREGDQRGEQLQLLSGRDHPYRDGGVRRSELRSSAIQQQRKHEVRA